MAGEIKDFWLSVAWISHTTSNHVIISIMCFLEIEYTCRFVCTTTISTHPPLSQLSILALPPSYVVYKLLETKRRVCSNPRVHMTWFEGLWDILATLSQKSLGEICRIAILIQGGGCTFSDVHNSTLPTHNKKNSTKWHSKLTAGKGKATKIGPI